MVVRNEARKVYISHGIINDENLLVGADNYISVSRRSGKTT